MNCREAHKLMIRAQDARLSWPERLGIRLHLMVCDACTNFRRQMDFIRAACRRFPGGGD